VDDEADEETMEALFSLGAKIDETVEDFERAKVDRVRLELLRGKYDIDSVIHVEDIPEEIEEEEEEEEPSVESRLVKEKEEVEMPPIPLENTTIPLRQQSYSLNTHNFPISTSLAPSLNDSAFYTGSSVPTALDPSEGSIDFQQFEELQQLKESQETQELALRIKKAHIRGQKLRGLEHKWTVMDEEGQRVPDPQIYNSDYHRALNDLFIKDSVFRGYKIKSIVDNNVIKDKFLKPIMTKLAKQ
jgi:hypothetical protein